MPRLTKGALSSGFDNWETPKHIFDALDKHFRFTLDPCADSTNAKCINYFTPEDDGLSKSWAGNNVFINPPYSQMKKWIDKGIAESRQPGTSCTFLVPARTDTKWFKKAYNEASSVWFISGRIKFIKDGVECKSPPFPSVVIHMRSDDRCWHRVELIDRGEL